ncbi:alternative oxidase superfamily protein [Syncephalis fuscata]|nr:alternative oxidase superfamily protein [Syncephalis fuscata]
MLEHRTTVRFQPAILCLQQAYQTSLEHRLPDHKPELVRDEFLKSLSTKELEQIDIGVHDHRKPENISDYVALKTVKFLRMFADAFFREKYLHRAVTLETVAAVPGMVAGVLLHLRSLRRMENDNGWIHHLLNEAENERMHLQVWIKLTEPTLLERALVTAVQGIFFNVYFLLYILSSKTAHRVVGYLEEEAIISYTEMLKCIDKGQIPNDPAPQIAIDYWNLPTDARIRDVTLAIRADEAMHRDTNHEFSDRIRLHKEDLRVKVPDVTYVHTRDTSL